MKLEGKTPIKLFLRSSSLTLSKKSYMVSFDIPAIYCNLSRARLVA